MCPTERQCRARQSSTGYAGCDGEAAGPGCRVTGALGLLEVRGWSPAMVALDAMTKSADVDLLQVELNDLYGVCIKIAGATAAVETAIATGRAMAEQMKVDCVSDVISAPDRCATPAFVAAEEFSPLIEQDVVHIPRTAARQERPNMSEQARFAIGMIETQGLTAVIEAIDTACKAGNVEIIGREKLGGGYITVLIKGDVAAVKAAVEAGRSKIESMGLGKLIAAHVIARPSTQVLSLLPGPKSAS
jgi:carbon dioxide concentrating mechanism protein CcmO